MTIEQRPILGGARAPVVIANDPNNDPAIPVTVSAGSLTDFMLEVAAGNVPGNKSVNKFGRSTNVDNDVATDIWDRANATHDQDIWIAPTQARIHNIASTSANDDGDPVGVGASFDLILVDN